MPLPMPIAASAIRRSLPARSTPPPIVGYCRGMTAISKGVIYFAAVFAFAFVMGVVRTLFVAPYVGSAVAVGIEVPIILAASWFVARRLLRRTSLTLVERATMGAIAFGLTMISEAALSVAMRGESVSQWAVALATPLGLLGLAGQVGFAVIPLFAGRQSGAGRA